jgi:hypothetical protein
VTGKSETLGEEPVPPSVTVSARNPAQNGRLLLDRSQLEAPIALPQEDQPQVCTLNGGLWIADSVWTVW